LGTTLSLEILKQGILLTIDVNISPFKSKQISVFSYNYIFIDGYIKTNDCSIDILRFTAK